MWYWKSTTTFKGFFKTINWIHRSQLKWNMIKTFPEATALHLPFYEQQLHYIVKPLNLSMWDRHHTWWEKMNSHSTFKRTFFCPYSHNPDPRLYLYMKIQAGTRQFFKTPSICWKYTEQKIACILQCKNSATKSFIADQETVSRD